MRLLNLHAGAAPDLEGQEPDLGPSTIDEECKRHVAKLAKAQEKEVREPCAAGERAIPGRRYALLDRIQKDVQH